MIKKQLYFMAGMLVAVFGTALPAYVYADDINVTKVKAALISILAFDTSWPASKALANESQINICVLGDSEMDKMTDVFQEASKKYKREYKLLSKRNINEVGKSCHIVFIGKSEENNLDAKLSTLAGESVLTVSDIEGFAGKGGMIEFAYVKQKVKVGVINNLAAKKSQITIAAGLLEVALKVIN